MAIRRRATRTASCSPLLQNSGDKQRAGVVARRLAVLDLLAGDREATARNLDAYRQATGKTLAVTKASAAAESWSTAPIPGPLRSFARMAAISAESAPEDVLPALARNVVTNGYQASHSNEALEQTEYLKLVHRYLSQARELDKLAGEQKVIKHRKLRIGHRRRIAADSRLPHARRLRREVVLETVNAARAFLTTDSGFPLNDLEQALRTNRPFTLRLPSDRSARCSSAPTTGWLGERERDAPNFIDSFIADPALCRLYLGLSKLDRETAEALQEAIRVPAPQGLRARAGFLRRDVRDPRRQSRGPGRPALRGRLGRAGRRLARTRARSSSKS